MFTREKLEALVVSDPLLHPLTSFSVVNDFMFRPPPPNYRGPQDIDSTIPRSVAAVSTARMTDSRGVAVQTSLVSVPWSHAHAADGRQLGCRSVGCAAVPIPCLYVRHPDSPYLMLFFHGNACDIGFPSAHMLVLYAARLRVSILAPDYPGYGTSGGEPSEAAVKRTVERVLQFVLGTCSEGFSLSRLLIMGQSIGTGAAMHAVDRLTQVFGYPSERGPIAVTPRAVELPPSNCLGGVILKAPFTSVKNIITTNGEFRDELAATYRRLGRGADGARRTHERQTPPAPSTSSMTAAAREQQQAATSGSGACASATCSESGGGEEGELLQDDVVVDVAASGDDAGAELGRRVAGGGAEDEDDDDDPPGSLLFRVGVRVICDRFRTCDIVRRCAAAGMWRHVPLQLIHGTVDTVIHFDHSVLLANWARCGVHPDASVGDGSRVALALIDGAGHNDVLAQAELTAFFVKELTLMRIRPGMVPAAAELVLPPSQLVPADTAAEMRQRYADRVRLLRRLLHATFLLAALAVALVCIALHLVYCNGCCSDSRIVAWGVIEFVGCVLVFIVSALSPDCGVLHGKHGATVPYLAARLIGYLLVAISGYFMAPLLVFLPSHRGGVDWGALRANATSSSHAAGAASFCSDAPRGVMLAAFAAHAAHLAWSVLRNK